MSERVLSGQGSLEETLRQLIAREGALPLDRFLTFCLSHETHGYYRSATPIAGVTKGGAEAGAKQRGDFTTAPETSQVFGEILGLWLAAQWQNAGAPAPFMLAEAGPGTGQLFADLWRTTASISNAENSVYSFHESARLHFIETSKTLRANQQEHIANLSPPTITPATWHEDLGTLPEGSLFFIANEFLDALPVRQYVLTEDGWCERGVTLDNDNDDENDGDNASASFKFCLLPPRLPLPEFPSDFKNADDSPPVIEISPVRESVVAFVATQIAKHGGAALFIDYGYSHPPRRSTLSAIRNHAATHPLQAVGQTDLSTHVDFAACKKVAERAGVRATLSTQREFLRNHGLEERARALSLENSKENPEATQTMEAAHALIQEGGLGDFLVLALTASHSSS